MEPVAEFDERLWGAMVDYVTVGVDKRLTVMFRNGTRIHTREMLRYMALALHQIPLS